jgi:hypothetical protein
MDEGKGVVLLRAVVQDTALVHAIAQSFATEDAKILSANLHTERSHLSQPET